MANSRKPSQELSGSKKQHKLKPQRKKRQISKMNDNSVGKPRVLDSLPSVNWKQFLATKEQDVSQSKKSRHRQRKFTNNNSSSASGTTGVVEARKRLTKIIGIDCEMVGVEDPKKNMLARVSIVNRFGECFYDKYVKPTEPVKDYRTWVSGIRPHDLENGEDFEAVKQEVADILQGRVVVGHALKNDFSALKLRHPRSSTRDTAKYGTFRKMFNTKSPALRTLAKSVLGVSIQEGEHSSVQDAKTALQLYMAYRNEWEQQIATERQKKMAKS